MVVIGFPFSITPLKETALFLKTKNTTLFFTLFGEMVERTKFSILLGVLLLIKHSTRTRTKIFHHLLKHLSRPSLGWAWRQKTAHLFYRGFFRRERRGWKTQRIQENWNARNWNRRIKSLHQFGTFLLFVQIKPQFYMH